MSERFWRAAPDGDTPTFARVVYASGRGTLHLPASDGDTVQPLCERGRSQMGSVEPSGGEWRSKQVPRGWDQTLCTGCLRVPQPKLDCGVATEIVPGRSETVRRSKRSRALAAVHRERAVRADGGDS